MLFDLKGKRRRTVQGVYLTLAVLMGAGLVLFGIGSSVNGGLFDAFKGGSGSSDQATKTVQKRIDAANRTLQTQPGNVPALAELVKSHYDLASAKADPQTSEFTKDALKDLLATDSAWQRYLKAAKKPDPSLARRALQAEDGLGRLTKDPQTAKQYWAQAAGAAEILTTAQPTANNYIALVQYATLAGQTRKADLAGKKAIAVAPKGQKQQAKAAVAQAKATPSGQAQSGQPVPGQ
jgi:hypothetical protein